MNKYLLIDIGGTSIKVATYDTKLSKVKEYPTEAKLGGKHLIKKINDIINEYHDFSCISISTAGQVDSDKGYIIYANDNIPGYTGTKWKKILEKKYKVPVYVENDVNAAALGELHYGIAKNHNNFLCLTYGTGIGGAIVINGDIYTGSSGIAGEFGALILRSDKHIKDKPYSGSYEEIASTTALVKKAKKLDSSLDNGRKIFSRIKEKKVEKLVDEWVKDIGVGLASLIHLFNPDMIVLGGGVLEQEILFNKIKKEVYSQIKESYKGVKIKKAKLGNKAGLYGALARIKKEIK